MTSGRRRAWRYTGIYAGLAPFVLIALFPVAWMAITAFALARLRLPGAERSGIALFMTYLVPPIVLFLPLTPVLARLGLTDSYWALVVLYPTFTIPFCTWLMLGFFRAVPRARGSGLARRLRADERLATNRPADLPARDRDDWDLRLQPVDAGVSLRGGVLVYCVLDRFVASLTGGADA
jgi:ABC-type glycerol-3-phosphate transport system permease component